VRVVWLISLSLALGALGCDTNPNCGKTYDVVLDHVPHVDVTDGGEDAICAQTCGDVFDRYRDVLGCTWAPEDGGGFQFQCHKWVDCDPP
jgi:hypothetical protein